MFFLAASTASPSSRGAGGGNLDCGEGLQVRFSRAQPVQGSVLLLELVSERPLTDLQATWSGRPLAFWSSPEGKLHRALLGVDLRTTPGPRMLSIEAVLEGGEKRSCGAPLSVRDGRFAVQRLTVPEHYVELSEKDLERARRENRELAAVFSAVPPERFWQGQFRLPLEDVAPSGNFGKRRVLNGKLRSPHSGEDFAAPAGSPVRATQRGRVALAKELFFLGKTVVVDHGLGLYSYYGHLKTLAVEAGNLVDQGATLGAVGATGRTTGSHLHWGVRLGDARVNPMDLLALPVE